MKLLLGQLFFIGVIWIAMAVFYNDMTTSLSRYTFYLVTSWLLFIIVITIKTWLKERKEKKN
ncbi:hypothetical protein [Oceanobacillus bengalensis]|uniref:Uncharacterized protein n=1 Tax=Oceanobacillus bengalensis TaxID=1435466 RepID=A0A494YW23_9BACI|nr:hypothetical protein [Oceanobacillus bengalensis]RKQ14410.1 hypothetical protein D8M05_13370 [Oceanobacillus bengalensis]